MLAQIVVGTLAGVILADHYKIDRFKSVLASIVLGFLNVWIFLHLTVRKGWTTGKAVGAIIVGYLLLMWAAFTIGFIITALMHTLKPVVY